MRWGVFFLGCLLLALGFGLIWLSDTMTSDSVLGSSNLALALHAHGSLIAVLATACQIFVLLDAIFLRFLKIKALWVQIPWKRKGDVARAAWVLGWFIIFFAVLSAATGGG